MAVIVVDASAAVEMLAGSEAGVRAIEVIGAQPKAVPAHFDAEVYRVLRAHTRRGLLSVPRLTVAVRMLALFRADRVPLQPLLPLAHELGDRFSAPDSFYVALARAYDAELVTRDGRLARAADGVARVRLV